MLKSIVLLSGGIDSTTLLAYLLTKSRNDEIYCLTFDYGQTHKQEIQSARQIVSNYNIKNHQTISMTFSEFAYSSLVDDCRKVQSMGNKDSQIRTYVPFRNMFFLTYGSAIAEKLGINHIYIGANKTDSYVFPDCSPDFFKSFEETANHASTYKNGSTKLSIHAPFISLEKSEIIRIGLDLNVDYSITHSCYFPDKSGFPCGMCDSCNKRKDAFNMLCIKDPAFK